jgi:hypothetical protein
LFTLHANVVLGESLVEYLLTREADTVETIWYGLYTVGGVCLLGVVPLVLYARYGVVTPAIAVVVLSAGYLYLADTEVLYLFLLSTPLFVSALLTVGTVEYLLVTVALLLGVPHVVVSAATFGELSPLPLVLSVGSLFVVAVPVLLFLQFDAVAPAVGAVAGLVFVLVVHWERLPTEYSFLSTQLLVPVFLFGGVECLLRSTNLVGT